jgi:hypothetical protein
MPSPPITTTSVDTGSIALRDEQYRDETLTLGGAVTVLPGTILARDSSTLKLVLFVKGGSTNGNGIPKVVLGYNLTGASGDNPVRVIEKGEVNKRRLIIAADGTGANVDNAVIDQLRAFGITPVDVSQLSS